MRFLALQTNVELLKKQFIPEGEHEILTVTRHPIKFIADFFGKTLLVLLLTTSISFSLSFFSSSMPSSLTLALTVFILLFYLYQIVKSYIAWRYNFLIVTSEKIIIIHHESFLHQSINSIHLENIRNTGFISQFFGIFRCGILSIDLLELQGGSTQVLRLSYIPAPDTIVSAIEHAIALKQQKKIEMETPKEQEQKAEIIKESLKGEVQHPPKDPEPPKTELLQGETSQPVQQNA